MIRQTALFLGLIIIAGSLAGCNTLFRASKGAAVGAASGAKQDVADFKNAVNESKKADVWMKDNLW